MAPPPGSLPQVLRHLTAGKQRGRHDGVEARLAVQDGLEADGAGADSGHLGLHADRLQVGRGCTPVSLHTHSSRPPSYNKGQYTYPPWVLGLGWGVASLSLAALPLAAAHALLKAGGSPWARLRGALASTITSCPCCGGKLDSQHRVRQGEVVAG